MDSIAGTLGDFATRFQGMHTTVTAIDAGNIDYAWAAPTPHLTMSPLAMWAQLALLGPAAGAHDDDIAPAVHQAHQMIGSVLQMPHPGCRLSAGLWLGYDITDTGLRVLAEDLAAQGHTSRRGRPDGAELDRWTQTATGGALPWFPLLVDDDAAWSSADHALTGALAFTASGAWPGRLETCWSGSLGDSWDVRRVVRTTGSECGLAWDDQLGYVGVTITRSGNGLLVASVIADPAARDTDVTAAATRLVRRFATGERILLPNASLPSGDHGWWRVDDSPIYGGFPEQQYNSSLLPAWAASDCYDVMAYGLGYWGVLQQGLAARLGSPYDFACAAHAALSRFDADGFTTAAATATRIGTGSLFAALAAEARFEPEDRRTLPPGAGGTLVELEYRHPFAAVVATSTEYRGHFWQGLPLQVSWVAQASEPQV